MNKLIRMVDSLLLMMESQIWWLMKPTIDLLIYYISGCWHSVAKRVEKTQRDFLWGGGNLEGKVHLVKWDVVCTEKHKGGLGLRRIASLNRALLGKWI